MTLLHSQCLQNTPLKNIFILACLIISTLALANTPPSFIHAKHFHAEKSNQVNSYWVSEKLDGVRAYWNGETLRSRSGKRINAPLWFTEHFPKQALDGELWLTRNSFDKLSGIVRRKQPVDAQWKNISYQLFELPKHPGTFTERINAMHIIVKQSQSPWLQVIEQIKIRNENELLNHLNHIVKQGGEGLMLHLETSLYHTGRSNDLLKLKPAFDTEAIVINIIPGKGKYTNKMGALLVQLNNGKRFKIGSGFTDKERENPPKIGTEITFEYSGLTSNGIPRFARFKRIRLKH